MTEPDPLALRCPSCGRLLARGERFRWAEFVCRRCHSRVLFLPGKPAVVLIEFNTFYPFTDPGVDP